MKNNISSEINEGKNQKVGHFTLDRRGRFLSADRNMEMITKYTEGELLELTLADLHLKEKEKLIDELLHRISVNGDNDTPFSFEIVRKDGSKIFLELDITAMKDKTQKRVGFQGNARNINNGTFKQARTIFQIDQPHMISEISQLVLDTYYEPLNVLLERIAKIGCQIFRFERSTIGLLDHKKNVFRKHVMIGYKLSPGSINFGSEVPREVIDQVFANRFLVKMIYHDQGNQDITNYLNVELLERRTQKRRPPGQWLDGDLGIVNLKNRNGKTFGYITFDKPVDTDMLVRDVFYNLEIFGQLVSLAIENHHQFTAIEKRSRRLKQLLVTSNIFKLNLKLDELFNEIVWSIKFSSDFNLVALGLISKKNNALEIKAVACNDKIVQNQLLEINFPLKSFIRLLRDEYMRDKSYLVYKREIIFRSFKQIYYGASLTSLAKKGLWPNWGVLLVPIKTKESKIIGILIADDPDNSVLPTNEEMRTLEILTNQFAIAIENRKMYVQSQKKFQEVGKQYTDEDYDFDKNPTLAIKRMASQIFKNFPHERS